MEGAGQEGSSLRGFSQKILSTSPGNRDRCHLVTLGVVSTRERSLK